VVFSVNTDESAVVTRRSQHIEKLLVIKLDAVVGHEDLDRGMALLNELRQMCFKRGVVRISQDHMKCVVNDGAPTGEIVIIGDDAVECVPDVLRGKRYDRRGAPKHR
jgi:hypothetical protein